MKILIVRHADPDYSIDSLTEKGKIEAELLSQRLTKLDIKDFYVSILGRARDTADYTLKKACYENVYGKELTYTFENSDIAGWKECL